MGRRVISIASAVIFLLLAFEQWAGFVDFLSRLPGAGGAVKNWLVEIDYSLLNNDIHPFLVAIGLVILFGGWIIPDVWPLVRQYFLSKNMEEFSNDFYKIENQQARQDFMWTVHDAYKNHPRIDGNETLRESLNALEFPDDFPPTLGVLHYYVGGIQWPNVKSEELWLFFQNLFSDASTSSRNKTFYHVENYQRFLDARRITSAFWDKWARKIIDGQINYQTLREPIGANYYSIQCLVLSELALVNELPYDLGVGKTSLFKLVLGPERLKKPGIVSRIRRQMYGSR
jgi:hypothetical protein